MQIVSKNRTRVAICRTAGRVALAGKQRVGFYVKQNLDPYPFVFHKLDALGGRVAPSRRAWQVWSNSLYDYPFKIETMLPIKQTKFREWTNVFPLPARRRVFALNEVFAPLFEKSGINPTLA